MRADFSSEAKSGLAARVGYLCSNPDCRAPTAGPQENPTKAVNIGVAAHIGGAAPGGPRYDPGISDDARCHPNNGIWLCQNCAKLIDNDVTRFPVSLLQAWKVLAEQRAKDSLGRQRDERQESEGEKKLNALLPWVGKQVKLTQMNTGRAVALLGPERCSSVVELLACDGFGAVVGKSGREQWSRRIPLTNITISFDDGRNCVEIRERYE